jgi:uncharacterized membrane protein
MSDLIAVAYPDQATAEKVRDELARLTREHVIVIQDIEDNFMRELGESLPDGGAALFVLVRQVTPDKVIPRISQHGGKILQTSLSNESEQRLQDALGAAAAAHA